MSDGLSGHGGQQRRSCDQCPMNIMRINIAAVNSAWWSSKTIAKLAKLLDF